MPTNERPGVYSSYEVSSAVSGGDSGGIVGIAAKAATGTAAAEYAIDSYAAAVSAFGACCGMTELIRLALLNGASSVRAVPAAVGADPNATQYTTAFSVLMADADVGVMICDSQAAAVHQALESAIAAADESRKYRIGVVEATGAVSDLVSAAAAIDNERMVLCGPTALTSAGAATTPGSVAAAVAGAIAATSDPALPLNGAELRGLQALAADYTDSAVNTLVRGGVTPLECVGGQISVIRGITTRTTTGGVSDSTWRELTTVLIINDVLPSIRRALRSRFTRAKNTARTRAAIRTQVIVELEDKLKKEIIDGYDSVTVTPGTEDATVCEVSFNFTVAHGLNQIQLTAHITV